MHVLPSRDECPLVVSPEIDFRLKRFEVRLAFPFQPQKLPNLKEKLMVGALRLRCVSPPETKR